MDYDRQGHQYVNGMSAPRQIDKRKDHNYKLVVDPFLHKGHAQKVYRFDGVMPGENRVVSTRDPRSRITRLWTRQQQADLPVPKFKYDEYYVGIPPPKDVTFTNLNDNINKDFLENMCKGCGKIEECKIYYHPKTRKHLGIGKTLFTSSKAARACVDKLNQTSKMGNIINVFIDTMGKERNRLIEELTTDQIKLQASPEQRRTSFSESQYVVPETEAYDPSDGFEMGLNPETEYTPSVETDYSGYSLPQSEMSYSSQDTGYSSAANSAPYHRDNYNQYSMDGPRNDHHGGNNYYPRHRGHYRENHNQQGHRSGHIIHHQPPSTPAHRHTPQPTPHYSHRDHNSHYGSFYAPPPPIPKPMFDRPPPPLPPEPPRNLRNDYEDSHDRPSKYNSRKKKNKEPKPPPRPPSPEPPSEGPRLESLESRIQSLLCSNAPGLGSPEHTSSSSQDESTPALPKTEEPSFEFYPPPATQPLPPLPELGVDDMEASPRDAHLPRPASSQEETEFESQVLDSQTVVEETVDCGATPITECAQNGTAAAPLPENRRVSKREDKGEEDEDDRMSLSSISSGEEKLEINPPLPQSTPTSSTPTKTSFTQSPQAASTSTATTASWAANVMTSPFLGSPPPGYQARLYTDQSPQKLEEEDPNYHTFTTVLDKFVKELKQILQKDLCKKMVENSAFKSFENWWDGEVLKSKKSQLAEKELEAVPSTSTAVKVKTEKNKPELSSSLASLFESRERGNIESSGMGYGGFLGIRGGMPKLPSFKRKFPRPSQVNEEDEDSRKTGTKSAGEEDESDDEVMRGSKQKAVISDSEESDDSSDEDKEDVSADEDEEGSEESSEEEEESEDSEEESSESEDSDAQEEEEQTEDQVTVKEDLSQEKPDNNRIEEKMVVDKTEDSEDEEVDVGTENELSFEKQDKQSDEKSSSMDTAESESSEKESPGKRPLSPILEEREKEEQTDVKEDNSKSATTTTTETSATSADSSAMDSDSSALEPVSPIKKPVPKRGKGRGSTSSVSPKAVSPATQSGSDSAEVIPDPVLATHSDVMVEEEVQDSETSHKLSESEAEQRSHFMVPAIAEHDYFSFPPASAPEESTVDSDRTESADEESETLSEVLVDHNYSLPPIVEEVRIGKAILKKESVISPKPAKETKKRVRAKKSKNNMLADITNRTEDKVSRELANLLTPAVVKPLPKLKARTFQEERQIFFDIYDKGISEEDVKYLKRSYDELIQSDDPNFYWLNDILWVDHTHTDIKDVLPVPPKKKKKTEDHVPKPHPTGCARAEGYYKLTMMEKAGYLRHAHNLQLQQKAAEDLKKVQEGKKAQSSREARHHNRRLQTTYSDLETDLLRFNQLKFRKKQLKFAKSGIHDWGLFALEPIASEEMVIEYVGQVVRQSIADEREKRYEAIGIGSSYLFRVDTETIIDATRTGNLARFINHSCNPNCYAKIITVEAEKKIVIYSKRDIDVNEEITYDYKFPIEDEKIPCLCMAPGCRGTLN